MTPANAIAAGADYLVVGRPIAAAPDPPAVVATILRRPLSSITSAMRSTIGPIRANPHARSFALDRMREVVAVGRAQGIALEADFADKRVAVIGAISRGEREFVTRNEPMAWRPAKTSASNISGTSWAVERPWCSRTTS